MVLATKERRSLITPQLKTDLHAYMVGISHNLKYVYAVNGVADHCHLVFDLSPTIALADFANRIKAGSTVSPPRPQYARVRMAAWVWCIQRQPTESRSRHPVRRVAGGAPPKASLQGSSKPS
jgi:REP element-mobilizing transposase RayT